MTYSITSKKKYPSFKKWWDAEGLPIWLASGAFVYLLISN